MSSKVTGTLPGWLPAMNRVIAAVQRLGLSVGPVRVLVVPGRSSGRPRETPVTPIEVDGRCYVVAALPNADWARNVRAAVVEDLDVSLLGQSFLSQVGSVEIRDDRMVLR